MDRSTDSSRTWRASSLFYRIADCCHGRRNHFNDRLHQRGKSTSRAWHDAETGNRRQVGDRSRPAANHPAIIDGKPPACVARGLPRFDDGMVGRAAFIRIDFRECNFGIARLTDSQFYRRGVAAYWNRFRPSARDARHSDKPYARAESKWLGLGWPLVCSRGFSLEVEQWVSGFANGALLDAAPCGRTAFTKSCEAQQSGRGVRSRQGAGDVGLAYHGRV